MRVEFDTEGKPVALVLSRRNLTGLLAKLDGHPSGSACELRAPSEYGFFAVKVEEDGPHYLHAGRVEAHGVCGRMHPDTERRVGTLSDIDAKLGIEVDGVRVAPNGAALDLILDPRD